jgi:hypothetical protein
MMQRICRWGKGFLGSHDGPDGKRLRTKYARPSLWCDKPRPSHDVGARACWRTTIPAERTSRLTRATQVDHVFRSPRTGSDKGRVHLNAITPTAGHIHLLRDGRALNRPARPSLCGTGSARTVLAETRGSGPGHDETGRETTVRPTLPPSWRAPDPETESRRSGNETAMRLGILAPTAPIAQLSLPQALPRFETKSRSTGNETAVRPDRLEPPATAAFAGAPPAWPASGPETEFRLAGNETTVRLGGSETTATAAPDSLPHALSAFETEFQSTGNETAVRLRGSYPTATTAPESPPQVISVFETKSR